MQFLARSITELWNSALQVKLRIGIATKTTFGLTYGVFDGLSGLLHAQPELFELWSNVESSVVKYETVFEIAEMVQCFRFLIYGCIA